MIYNYRLTERKVVVTLRNEDGSFLDKVNIPTVMWPLDGPYEIFSSENCSLVPMNSPIRSIVDSVPYQVGHCYSNAEAVAAELRAAGFNVRQYAGWLFVSNCSYPIHHAWVVVDGSVIDLSDEFAVLAANADKFEQAGSKEECRELFVDFERFTRQLPNSIRTMPFGVPASNLLYVGCECDRERAISIFNNLIDAFPNHPAAEKARPGEKTQMQKILEENGLF